MRDARSTRRLAGACALLVGAVCAAFAASACDAADTGDGADAGATAPQGDAEGPVFCPPVRLTCGSAVVLVQTIVLCRTLALDADEPIASDTWQWSLEQPVGSASELVRGAQSMSFEANVIGRYAVSVAPPAGAAACTPARVELMAVAMSPLHVELLWHTPGDPDESDTGVTPDGDSVGSDLDLHVRHARADGWFDERWDASWMNDSPDWGGSRARDDPRLDRDDADGAGPESFDLDVSEPVVYRVGVHVWDDWGFGPSYATVRVYIDGALAFVWADVRMDTHDLWEVATIDGATLEVTPLGGGAPLIIPDYPAPAPEMF